MKFNLEVSTELSQRILQLREKEEKDKNMIEDVFSHTANAIPPKLSALQETGRVCTNLNEEIEYRNRVEEEILELHGWLESQWEEAREKMEGYEDEDEETDERTN